MVSSEVVKISSVNLSAKQKAAILLISLPPEVSNQLMRSFSPEEVTSLTLEMSKLPNISPEIRAAVIEEFFQTTDLSQLGVKEHSTFADLVERPVSQSTPSLERPKGRPLELLRKVDPHQILNLVRREHPQTIALVLSHLQPSQASAILSELSPNLQSEVARRVAEIGKISPEVLREVEQVLEERLFAMVEGEYGRTDGKEALIEILSQSDRSTEEKIISGLTRRDPKLVTQIKNQLCEFTDLVHIDDQSLRQVLRVTDIRDLVLALKGSPPEISERIYGCMTPEAAKALREDVEALGRVDWDEIRAAQQQIRNNLRGLVTIGKVKFG